jgi:tetratricopeptide (TPR) repeat protein
MNKPTGISVDREPPLPAQVRAAYLNRVEPISHAYADNVGPEQLAELRALNASGRCEEAIARVDSIPGARQSFSGPTQRGLALMRLKHLDEAQDEFDQSLRLADRLASIALTNLACTLVLQKKYAKARTLAARAARRSPDWAGPWVTKLSALNLAHRKADIRGVAEEMSRYNYDWRSDPDFIASLRDDPHLVGVKNELRSA